MDPQRPESFNHRTELLATGRSYHFVDQVPQDYDPERNVTILCIHGFPDLWYGWRHQIGPWVRRGARIIAPDMLGYGGTSQPLHPPDYTTKKLSADLDALLDKIGVKQVVVVGHDWGAYLSARFTLYYPHRVLALALLSVPYAPPAKQQRSLEDVAKLAPNLGYQLYLASERSNLEILAQSEKFLKLIYQGPNSSHDFTQEGALRQMLYDPGVQPQISGEGSITEQDFQYYLSHFKKGMWGPLNYYRTTELRCQEETAYGLSAHFPADLPVLFIYGTADPTVVQSVVENSKKFIPRYQLVAVEGKGHWLMVDSKDVITNRVAEWLECLRAGRSKL